MCLELDIEYFNAKRAEWLLSHEGEYALVKEGRLRGFPPTLNDAYAKGLSEFGDSLFLVKCVVMEEGGVAMLPTMTMTLPDDDA